MLAWRLCGEPLADLSREGARLYGGQWNTPGRPLIYARRSRSSKCVLRLDLTPDLLPADYVLLAVDLGDLAVEELTDLPTDPAASGDAWLASQWTAVLQVPSIIVLESSNLLLNSRHPDAGQIRIARR